MTVGENIARARKEKGWTQAELGERLGVSNQAVSKWEAGTTSPDILLLPLLADVFDCSIDDLFSRTVKREVHYGSCAELPWKDDNVLRGVVCLGKKILQVSDNPVKEIAFKVTGDVGGVSSECNVSISGSVTGGCRAGRDLVVGGSVMGGCHSDRDIVVTENLTGSVICHTLTTSGNVEAGSVVGKVTCNILKCDKVMGNVTVLNK